MSAINLSFIVYSFYFITYFSKDVCNVNFRIKKNTGEI